MFLLCSEMSTDAGPGFGYTQPAGKMREEYSSIDVSSDTQPSAVRELDDNLRPTMDREGKLPLFFLQLQECVFVYMCVCFVHAHMHVCTPVRVCVCVRGSVCLYFYLPREKERRRSEGGGEAEG